MLACISSVCMVRSMMHLSARGICHPHPFYMDGVQLETVTDHRYLGVTLTETLSWNSHVDVQCSKAESILRPLMPRNLGKYSMRTKSVAYQTLVRPDLEYSASAWDQHTIRNTQETRTGAVLPGSPPIYVHFLRICVPPTSCSSSTGDYSDPPSQYSTA